MVSDLPGNRYWFCRPQNQKEPTRFLFVGSKADGNDVDRILLIFSEYGSVEAVVKHPSSPYVYFVIFQEAGHAKTALANVGGLNLHSHGFTSIKYAEARVIEDQAITEQDTQLQQEKTVYSASETGIPGLFLLYDFINSEEEELLLSSLDHEEDSNSATSKSHYPDDSSFKRFESQLKASESMNIALGTWERVSKRRVQHFGFRFDYATRSFSSSLGPLPPLIADVAEKISKLPEVGMPLDQVTANDYAPGVGLAPHIDTHFAFTGPIISLSLGSHCTMELKKGVESSSSGTTPALESDSRGEEGQPSSTEVSSCLLFLPRRSLLILSGESRYAWQHGITAWKSDMFHGQSLERQRRVSLTLRKVRGYACDCDYPKCCDSQEAPLVPTRLATKISTVSSVNMSTDHNNRAADLSAEHSNALCSEYASLGDKDRNLPAGSCTRHPSVIATEIASEAALKQLELDHVVDVYDAIAQHFSATRFAIWPKVKEFMDLLPKGAVVADVGCGNGKYFGVRDDVAVIGSDRSSGLASVAGRRLEAVGMVGSHFTPGAPPGADVFVADALSLPYRPSSCDAALCIAVLHHLSSAARRLKLLEQLILLLKPGGQAIVTVWATEQEEPEKTVKKWTLILPSSNGHNAEAIPPLLQQGSGGGDNGYFSTSKSRASGSGSCEETERSRFSEESRTEERTGKVQAPTASGGADYFVPWNLPCHRAEAQGALNAGKMKIDKAKGSVVFQRYYHLFTKEELSGLVATMPNAKILDVFYDKSNWCIVFEKTSNSVN
ncbi:hypothetical protein CEUSTIGMA_g8733.t1 [Chlamydomonas eustigma]|uniref:Fe2OG dioxygenase domain-containing protein n=1 Tax=Chlamydomonas eustigma TaxID=1157962 RepID=A0A250XEG6_9CHLO|nr:hypothetical protein CEUSTIGMA_g8733.t1 [Chlamydomonas eustigma]|eukprot:GAX81302.1 hypothetical protein CEUSTIGMA_g8733.t1 [Chlamydomonas eustigma]